MVSLPILKTLLILSKEKIMKNYVLAHDLGTTGNKATLYDAEGRLIGSAFYGYATEYAHPRWAEQDPEDWWCPGPSATTTEAAPR